MKKYRKLIATLVFTLSFTALLAQAPPPPNGGSNPGGGNTPVGNGAPIGSGIAILLGLGAAYGGKKIYDLRKEQLED
ncbi:MAG: hypothetical protein K9G61_08235 [Bacteroidales bacterium]|nr:hypothetical protein [Bacteroidales bacterium]